MTKVAKRSVLIFVVILVLTLGMGVFVIRNSIEADNFGVLRIEPSNAISSGDYSISLEELRKQYAAIQTVELDADAAVDVIKPESTTSGTGHIIFSGQNNKYKYSCSISSNVKDEGMMPDVEILFTGSRYYFYDGESKVVSFQSSEDNHLITALPNPLFLPMEFLSNDDDGCEGCKMRLSDFSQPIRWPKRVSNISEISSEITNGTIFSLIEMPGGTMNQLSYNYRLRLQGTSSTSMFPTYVARVRADGLPLVEVLLNDFRSVPGISAKIPHQVEISTRDENGAITLHATFSITRLKINQSFANELLTPSFPAAESYWDSDSNQFVRGLQ